MSFVSLRVRNPGRLGALLAPLILLLGCGSDPAGPGNDPPPEEIELAFVWEDESANQTFTVLYDRAGRSFFYVVNREAGLLVYDASDSDEPELVHTVPGSAFGGRYTNNLTQVGTRLYVATGNFMGVPQQTPGLAIVDVSNPAAAFVMDTWTHGAGTRGAHAVEVRGSRAFLAASLEGLIVLDVSNPGAISFVSQFVPDPNFPTPNPGIFQMPAVRGLAVVNENLLLLTYDAGGFRTIDISNPAAPQQISAYVNSAISPQVQAQAFNNVVVEGTTAYVAVDYCGVEVLDFSNPAAVEQIAWWDPWECAGSALNWFDSPGHTNELVLRPEQDRLFVSGGASELLVLDVSDPRDPVLEASYGGPEDTRAAWGLDATATHVYLAHIASPAIPFVSDWSGVVLLSY